MEGRGAAADRDVLDVQQAHLVPRALDVIARSFWNKQKDEINKNEDLPETGGFFILAIGGSSFIPTPIIQ